MKGLILSFFLLIAFSVDTEAQKSPRLQAEGEINQTKIAKLQLYF